LRSAVDVSQSTDPPSSTARPTRPEWRDGIKASDLPPTTRLVALLMADYWPKDGGHLWCAVSTLMEQSGLSRATVYRALAELQAWGWLVQVEGHAQHRSPRYLPRLGVQRSHPETAEVSQRDPEVADRDPTPQDSTPDSTVGQTPSNSGLPGGRELRSRRPRDRPLSQQDTAKEWTLLRELMAAEGMDDDPRDVWWTLIHEHRAKRPGSWMRARVEAGEWDGFLGSHGITEYDWSVA
jgi:hypothetical protein